MSSEDVHMKLHLFFGFVVVFLLGAETAQAQQHARRLSIAAGGIEGIDYPLASVFAGILAKDIPGVTATAAITSGGSNDNINLISSGKADIAFTQVDAAADALNGRESFPKKVPLRALVVMYVNLMQVVTLEGNGITKFEDLKGKHVSTGLPRSSTEVFAFRVFEAAGLDKDSDISREPLSANQSANALRDRKLHAFMFVAGVPTSAITELAVSPGPKMLLLDHDHTVSKMVAKYGPAYRTGLIPKGSYPNQDKDNKVAAVWNIMAVRDDFPDDLAYSVTKAMLEKREDLGRVDKEAFHIKPNNQKSQNASIPWHPAALKYFTEKGIKVE